MENETGYIYKHTNKKNGKIYIGQTKQKPEKRWNNGKGYQNSTLFWNAIIAEGWNNFTHEILEENIPIDQLNEKEQYYIKKYKSDEDKYGYNMTSGGAVFKHNFSSKKQRVRCVETGEIYNSIKEANIAFGLSEKSCCIMRVCRGQQKTSQGYTFEYVDPDSARPKTHYNGKKVRNKNTGEIFPSAVAAANSLGLYGTSTSVISRACLQGTPYQKDKNDQPIYWEYVKEENKNE